MNIEDILEKHLSSSKFRTSKVFLVIKYRFTDNISISK